MKNKEEILALLNQAKSLADGRKLVEAIKGLQEAAKLISEFSIDVEHGTVKNATQNNSGLEIAYLHKAGNIYYELEEYKEAENLYRKLTQKLPGENKGYRAVGDCLRKQGLYQEAIEKYKQGLKKCEDDDSVDPQDEGALQNSLGLTYVEMQEYQSAIAAFDKALEINDKNALYYCNKGSALYGQGNKKEAIDCFKHAQSLLKAGTLAEGLTRNNLSFIEQKLLRFVDQLENLEKIKLPEEDTIIENRQKAFARQATRIIKEDANSLETDANKILETKDKVRVIKQTGELNRYYDGFLTTLSQTYATSVMISSGTFVLDSGNTLVSIAIRASSFIPFVGNAISNGVQAGWDFAKGIQMKKAANNVWEFATTQLEFDSLAQDATATLILERSEQIKMLKPESYCLPKWTSQFNSLVNYIRQKAHDVEVKLYGERFKTSLQKLGYQNASSLIEKYMASGKIYGDDLAIDISEEEKKKRLIKLALEFLDQDIASSKGNLQFTAEAESATSQSNKGAKQSGESEPPISPQSNKGAKQSGESESPISLQSNKGTKQSGESESPISPQSNKGAKQLGETKSVKDKRGQNTGKTSRCQIM